MFMSFICGKVKECNLYATYNALHTCNHYIDSKCSVAKPTKIGRLLHEKEASFRLLIVTNMQIKMEEAGEKNISTSGM